MYAVEGLRPLQPSSGGLSMKSPAPFDAAARSALLDFNGEAVVYCRGIANGDAQEYAMDYARALRSRAKGIESTAARFSAHLFEPDRNLIKGTLDQMYRKYFAA
jgi:hypothetical protein